jgi:hypothetical protein
VVITDDLLQESVKEVHKLGIISHMRKPFTPGMLKAATNDAIEWIRGKAIENMPGEEFTAPMLAELDKVIHQFRENSGHIIHVLLLAQDIFGYLPSAIQKRIAQGMKIYPSEIHSIVSSNSCFRTKPGSDHSPCYMGRREKIWRDVTWKTDRRVINAVNEFIKGRNWRISTSKPQSPGIRRTLYKLTITDLHNIQGENRARFALKKAGHRARSQSMGTLQGLQQAQEKS